MPVAGSSAARGGGPHRRRRGVDGCPPSRSNTGEPAARARRGGHDPHDVEGRHPAARRRVHSAPHPSRRCASTPCRAVEQMGLDRAAPARYSARRSPVECPRLTVTCARPHDRLSRGPRAGRSLADAADAITLARFGAADLVVEAKPDLTPVSDADRAVEQAIRARLARDRPDDAVLGRGVRRDRHGSAPLGHRSDRRHEELRPRRAGVGHADRAARRRRAGRRRGVGARARPALVGGPRRWCVAVGAGGRAAPAGGVAAWPARRRQPVLRVAVAAGASWAGARRSSR